MKLLIYIFIFSLTVACAEQFQNGKESVMVEKHEKSILKEKGWKGDNAEKISDFFRRHGEKGGVAVFDWDNTVIKNDMGDALFFHMIETGSFTAVSDFADLSIFFTDEAVAALNEACLDSINEGRIRSDIDKKCARELLSVYDKAETTAGNPAFSGFEENRTEPSYALLAHMLGGLTRREIKNITKKLFTRLLEKPIGSEKIVAGFKIPDYVRIYPQMKELIKLMNDYDFDVRIVSASPQEVVEACAEKAGISADRVIGIRNVNKEGILTRDIHGCGDVADYENTMITYKIGKRCWINKEVFKRKNPCKKQPEKYRPVFGAGDSDTDIFFMKDVVRLRLLIDRNKPLITEEARLNKDGKWIIQPMFIK